MLQPLAASAKSLRLDPTTRIAQLLPSQKAKPRQLLARPILERLQFPAPPAEHPVEGAGAPKGGAPAPLPGVRRAEGGTTFPRGQREGREGAGRGAAPAPPPCSRREVNKPRAGCGRRGRRRARRAAAGWPARPPHQSEGGAGLEPPAAPPVGRGRQRGAARWSGCG